MIALTKPFAATLAALCAVPLLASCGDIKFNVDGDGVPLAELDTANAAPTGVTLAGPDEMVVTTGDAFSVTAEGDAEVTDRLRYEIDGDTLKIYRDDDNWSGNEKATVRVTMTSVNALTIAGSGTIQSDTLSGDAEVNIAGSGTARAARIDAEKLAVSFAGSGRFEGAGTAQSLSLDIAGSGTADMAELKVGEADIDIAGSGDAAFASDGEVKANIVGSGRVRVSGSATCNVDAVGSGSLVCEKPALEPAE